jgi:uncharacterized protein
MLTKKTAIARVRNFAREVKDSGVHLHKVILFGSYASGKAHRWSDVDVALVAKEFTGDGFADASYFARINNKKPYMAIEPKTFSTAYFKKGDPFIKEIIRTGIEVEVD